MPWRHHIALLEKLSVPGARLWYASAAVEHGWSRDVLGHSIETKFLERSRKAITNFTATLPSQDSDLARQAMKDPYVFDFFSLTDKYNERELEGQLTEHVEKFLLELGHGFAFDPGYLGQLGMYMAVVDDLMAHADDQPAIGLLLCNSIHRRTGGGTVRATRPERSRSLMGQGPPSDRILFRLTSGQSHISCERTWNRIHFPLLFHRAFTVDSKLHRTCD